MMHIAPHTPYRWAVGLPRYFPERRTSMYILRGLLDRIVLLAAFLVAGCVPAFIAQYRQRLGGALDQVTKDLAPFREIAKQFHGGKLEKLIEHHQFSPDATFQAEGNAIQAMVRSMDRLRDAVQALETDLIHQVLALVNRGDPQIAKATWAAYEPAMSFSLEGLLFAGGVAVSVWLVFILCWLLFFGFLGWLQRMRAMRA